MKKLTAVAASALVASLALNASAQDIKVFGGNAQDRTASTKIIFDGNQCIAMVSVQYGQPGWKDEHAAFLSAKSANARLGKDFWTTLNTSVDIEFGESTMPAGSYYLGLHADDKGQLHLAAFEAASSDKAKQFPFIPMTWTIGWTAPLTHTKVDAMAEKLAINLNHAEGDSHEKMTFQIHWGNHSLTSPITLKTSGGADAGHDKDSDHGKDSDHDKKGEHGTSGDAAPVRRR